MELRFTPATGLILPSFYNVTEFPGTQPTVNYVVAGQAAKYSWEGVNALSIRMIGRGGAEFATRDGKYRVEGDQYLLLNANSKYRVVVRPEQPADVISVFFRPGFAEQVSKDIGGDGRPVKFYEHVFPGGPVTEKLVELRQGLPSFGQDPRWIELQTRELMISMLEDHRAQLTNLDKVPALRVSTQEDLYRRLLLAQDYAVSCFSEQVTLADLARVACLSPSYFLRAYRTVFGETPHQTVVRRRLERAKDLLSNSRMSVQDICRSIGFVSLGSFSWLFRNRVGVPPQEFRRLTNEVRTTA